MMASSSAPQPKRSTVPSSSHAWAWSGLADERQKVTMPGSPQRSTTSPSGAARAATARCTLSTTPARRAWTMISGCWMAALTTDSIQAAEARGTLASGRGGRASHPVAGVAPRQRRA